MNEQQERNNDANNRYCDYVHNLVKIKGLVSDIVGRDILPLREIPHKSDPRRKRSYQKFLDMQRTRDEQPLTILAGYDPQNPPKYLLRRIVIPFKRCAPLDDPSHMPNCRDPRRYYACDNYRGSSGGCPPTLVENPEVPAEMETCPVLTIDVTDWPNSKYCYIELVPHECNIERAAQIYCDNNIITEQLMNRDNENSNVLLETMRCGGYGCADIVEIVDDDVMEVSGYDAGDGKKPMLAMDDSRPVRNESVPDFLGDDEPAPIPVVKTENFQRFARRRVDESEIETVDLCEDEDEDVKPVLPRRERSSSIECLGERTHKILAVVTLDSDLEDEDERGDSAVESNSQEPVATASENLGTPAERTSVTPTGIEQPIVRRENDFHEHLSQGDQLRSEEPESVFIESEQSSASTAVNNVNSEAIVDENCPVVNCSAYINNDAIDDRDDQSTSVCIDYNCQLQDNVMRDESDEEYNRIKHRDTSLNKKVDEILKKINVLRGRSGLESCETAATVDVETDEAQTNANLTETVDIDVVSKPELPTNLVAEACKNVINHLNVNKTDNQTSRKGIITSEAFDVQKRILIDVILNANNQENVNDNSTSEYSKTSSYFSNTSYTSKRPILSATCSSEQLQQQNFFGDLNNCSDKRKRQSTPENISSDLSLFCDVKRRKEVDENEYSIVVPLSSGIKRIDKSLSTQKKRKRNRRRKKIFKPINTKFINEKEKYNQIPVNVVCKTIKPQDKIEISANVNKSPRICKNSKHRRWKSAPAVRASYIFSFSRLALNFFINYLVNCSITLSDIEYLLDNFGGLSFAKAIQIANETFWRNRYDHWKQSERTGSIDMRFSDLPINKTSVAVLYKDDETKNQIKDVSYFFKDPILKSNKPVIQSAIKDKSYLCFCSVEDTFQINPTDVETKKYATSKNNMGKIKIAKRHSLPSAAGPENYSHSKRCRSKSQDSLYSPPYKDISESSIKLTLIRDQINKKNWISSQTNANSSISKNVSFDIDDCKHDCENFSKCQSFNNTKNVPELDINHYGNQPIINNFIEKQNLEKNLSPFLKSRIKRRCEANEILDTESESMSNKKRLKLSENSFNSTLTISNVNNDVSSCLDYKRQSKKDSSEVIPKNSTQTVLNSNKNGKEDGVEINIILQTDHNSNIESNSKENDSDIYKRKKQRSEEKKKINKKKVVHIITEFFGETDSDSNDAQFFSKLNSSKKSTEICTSDTLSAKTNCAINAKQNNSEVRESINNFTRIELNVLQSTKSTTSDTHLEEQSEDCISIETNPVENHTENKSLEESSFNLSKTSKIDIKQNEKLKESNNKSVTLSIRAKEILGKCVQDQLSEVPSSNNLLNKTLEINLSETISENNDTDFNQHNNNKYLELETLENQEVAETIDQEAVNLPNINIDQESNLVAGDFEYAMSSNHSDYSDCYDPNLDCNEEFEDLSETHSINEQISEKNDNSISKVIKLNKSHRLIEESEKIGEKQMSTHSLDKLPTYYDHCVTNILDNCSCNKDDDDNDIQKSNDPQKVLFSSSSPSSSPTHSSISSIASPSSISSALVIDESFDGSVNVENCSEINDTTVISNSTTLSDFRNHDKLKDPDTLTKYNLSREIIAPDESTFESSEIIENLEAEEFNKSLDLLMQTVVPESNCSHSSEIITSEKDNYVKPTNVQILERFNLHYVNDDINSSSSTAVLTQNDTTKNDLSVYNPLGKLKIRNINELLEKPETSSLKNKNSINENSPVEIESVSATNTNPNISNAIDTSTNNTSLNQFNNPISANLTEKFSDTYSVNSIPQVCVKLASNMFFDEFSNASNNTDDLLSTYSKDSPSFETPFLSQLFPTEESQRKYKSLLLYKIDHSLKSLQKFSEIEWIKYSNNLLNYETLSENTWIFQIEVLTIIQCIQKLIQLSKDKRFETIQTDIESSLEWNKNKKRSFQKILEYNMKFTKQGVSFTRNNLFDPLLLELEEMNKSTCSIPYTMNQEQKVLFFTQVQIYNSMYKTDCLQRNLPINQDNSNQSALLHLKNISIQP